MRGTLFGVLIIRDPTIWGTILGSPIFGNPHMLLLTGDKKLSVTHPKP